VGGERISERIRRRKIGQSKREPERRRRRETEKRGRNRNGRDIGRKEGGPKKSDRKNWEKDR
jgi:hypothetical protein